MVEFQFLMKNFEIQSHISKHVQAVAGKNLCIKILKAIASWCRPVVFRSGSQPPSLCKGVSSAFKWAQWHVPQDHVAKVGRSGDAFTYFYLCRAAAGFWRCRELHTALCSTPQGLETFNGVRLKIPQALGSPWEGLHPPFFHLAK